MEKKITSEIVEISIISRSRLAPWLIASVWRYNMSVKGEK